MVRRNTGLRRKNLRKLLTEISTQQGVIMIRIQKDWRINLTIGGALLIAFGLIGYGFLMAVRIATPSRGRSEI
jgi:hypothetical protein